MKTELVVNKKDMRNNNNNNNHTDEGFQGREANRPENENHHESGPGTTLNDSFATDNEEKIREARNDILREYSISQHTEMHESCGRPTSIS